MRKLKGSFGDLIDAKDAALANEQPAPQQAGVSAEAVAKLVGKWREERPSYPYTPDGIAASVAVKLCADELEALATAPPEQVSHSDINAIVDWLVKQHGLKESSQEIVRNNLRAQEAILRREVLRYAAQIAEECTSDETRDEKFRIAQTLRALGASPQAASAGALDYANELIEDLLANEECSCLKVVPSQHPCARCIITIEEARKYIATCTVPDQPQAASGGALADSDVEKLAAELHEVYWQESIRQRDTTGLIPRYRRNYNELSEDIKDYDRALARFMLRALAAHDQKVRAEVCEEIARYLEVNHRDDDDAEWEACCNLPERVRSLAGAVEKK